MNHVVPVPDAAKGPSQAGDAAFLYGLKDDICAFRRREKEKKKQSCGIYVVGHVGHRLKMSLPLLRRRYLCTNTRRLYHCSSVHPSCIDCHSLPPIQSLSHKGPRYGMGRIPSRPQPLDEIPRHQVGMASPGSDTAMSIDVARRTRHVRVVVVGFAAFVGQGFHVMTSVEETHPVGRRRRMVAQPYDGP